MDKRFGRLISILYRKGQMYLSKTLKECNLNGSEVPVLLFLYHQDGVTQEDLATHMSLDKSAITRIINSLLGKKYITKVKDEKDHRCNRIYITNECLAIKETIVMALDNWNQLLMDGLNETQQQQTYALLEHMVKNIKGDLND